MALQQQNATWKGFCFPCSVGFSDHGATMWVSWHGKGPTGANRSCSLLISRAGIKRKRMQEPAGFSFSVACTYSILAVTKCETVPWVVVRGESKHWRQLTQPPSTVCRLYLSVWYTGAPWQGQEPGLLAGLLEKKLFSGIRRGLFLSGIWEFFPRNAHIRSSSSQ